MNARMPSLGLGIGLVATALLVTPGCQSDKPDEWYDAAPAGSVSDINRKLTGQKEGPSVNDPKPQKVDIILLVAHDADGKPQYVETQRSSGDPALDRRAQDFVLKNRRFPKGAANTVVVTLDPKSLPKP